MVLVWNNNYSKDVRAASSRALLARESFENKKSSFEIDIKRRSTNRREKAPREEKSDEEAEQQKAHLVEESRIEVS